jgi:hypothetical protein
MLMVVAGLPMVHRIATLVFSCTCQNQVLDAVGCHAMGDHRLGHAELLQGVCRICKRILRRICHIRCLAERKSIVERCVRSGSSEDLYLGCVYISPCH